MVLWLRKALYYFTQLFFPKETFEPKKQQVVACKAASS